MRGDECKGEEGVGHSNVQCNNNRYKSRACPSAIVLQAAKNCRIVLQDF